MILIKNYVRYNSIKKLSHLLVYTVFCAFLSGGIFCSIYCFVKQYNHDENRQIQSVKYGIISSVDDIFVLKDSDLYSINNIHNYMIESTSIMLALVKNAKQKFSTIDLNRYMAAQYNIRKLEDIQEMSISRFRNVDDFDAKRSALIKQIDTIVSKQDQLGLSFYEQELRKINNMIDVANSKMVYIDSLRALEKLIVRDTENDSTKEISKEYHFLLNQYIHLYDNYNNINETLLNIRFDICELICNTENKYNTIIYFNIFLFVYFIMNFIFIYIFISYCIVNIVKSYFV